MIKNVQRKGFTFLEIMFVVVIIGILVSIVGPKLTGRSKKARVMATRATIKSLETALQTFEMNVGTFPTTEQGLEALIKCPSDVPEEDWDSSYLRIVPKDTFGQEFIYKCPGENNEDYDLYSKGPDRSEDTEDDIVNWQKEEDDL
jgi:general secretion pathway protein G